MTTIIVWGALNCERIVSSVACTTMGDALIVRVLYMVIGGCAQARNDLDVEWMGLFFVMGGVVWVMSRHEIF